MMDSFAVSTKDSAVFDPYTDNCPQHGKVPNMTFSYDGKEIGRYCFLCYHEWIKANVTPTTPA